MSSEYKDKARNRGIDILKGIGILFVFIGHMGSPYGGGTIVAYAYSFHMPLFFLVAGYLSTNVSSYSIVEYTKKKAKALLIPYALIFLFSYLWTNTLYPLSQGLKVFPYPHTLTNFLKAFILSGGYLEKIPLNNFPLWFLPLMFIASLVFYFILQIKDKRILLSIAFIISLITIPLQNFVTGRPAWHINVLPAAIFYMLIGYLFKKYTQDKAINKYSYIAATASLFLGYIIFSFIGSQGGIAHLSSYWYFLSSTLTVYGLYVLTSNGQNRVLEYMGKESLYLFALQVLILLQLPYLGLDNFFINKGQNGVVIYLIQLITGISLTILLNMVIKYTIRSIRERTKSFNLAKIKY